MQTTPPDIRDSKLLRLLGEILRSDVDGSNTSGLRLQLMGSGFSWQALVDLALGQGVLLPLIFALTARMLSPPHTAIHQKRQPCLGAFGKSLHDSS